MKDDVIVFGDVKTARLGRIWAAVSRRGLVALDFGVTRSHFEAEISKRNRGKVKFSPRGVRGALRQIGEYAAGKRRKFDIAIDWSVLASDFQRATLRAVFSIPYGHTRSYAEVAAQIGHPQAQRAVGRANATNPMPLVIPCHRVIGADGSLHGYGGAGGIKTKAWLLKMESSHVARSG